ncbi:hypothetical protein [Enterobacter hormaechei]|uniref:hypothetical protein n=1 Tax=Enterobacter hormaechei TaxID=158836 RepID=UPI0007967DC8|nr:hypothetical protein [Enterobacter hormaechei]CZY54582.1 Uncharacterised protein [Enterobacter hormaechei]CZY68083.1 Uncharacterised protein [Enterobacter hormaechei]CZY75214.1 Uncharacterised protein [Enterobacter hormaechei]SAF33236.1 Uncharacterised protein [Enterobacter hormaechei]
MTNDTKLVEEQLALYFSEVIRAVKEDCNRMEHLLLRAESVDGLSEFIFTNRTGCTVYSNDALFFLKWIECIIFNGHINDKFEVIAIYYIIDITIGSDVFWSNNRLHSDPKIFYSTSIEMISSSISSIDYCCDTDFHNTKKKNYINDIVKKNDWYSIYNEFHREADVYKLFLNHYIKSSVDFLYYNCREMLIDALNRHRDVPVLWGVFDYLGEDKALDLAISTNSACINFYTIASIFPFNRIRKEKINKDRISELLLNVFVNLELSGHFMKIFNTFPSRYPTLQQPLGKALASIKSEGLMTLYFNSISLHLYELNSDNGGRKAVSECMSEFSLYAEQSFRMSTWKIAYELWREWFQIKELKAEFLNEIKVCDIDYAITMYYLECCTKEEREAIMLDIINEMKGFSSRWYSTSSAMTSFWYTKLCVLQPVSHAENIAYDVHLPIAMLGRTYMPICFQENEYIFSTLRG